jgi:hypothetical protein
VRNRRLIQPVLRGVRVAAVAITATALLGCHGKQQGETTTTVVPTSEPPAPALTDIYLTDDKENAVAKNTFVADTKPVFVMYTAAHVKNVPIRAVWMLDEPGGGTKTVLDEQEITSASAEQSGAFSERPPMTGWALGPYEVQIYFGQNLVHSEHFDVVNAPVAINPESTAGVPTASPALPTSGVLKPNVTPIPEPTATTHFAHIPREVAPLDSAGRVLLGIHDAYMLHVSQLCRDVRFTVFVNGKRQGIYAIPDVTSDISLDFSTGPNSIRISWVAPYADRDCQMAIQLRRGKRLRTLTQIHVFRLSPPRGAVALGVVVE